jgi:hypothetical protein
MMGFNSVPILPQHFAEAQARVMDTLRLKKAALVG